ncbi:2Fe-2S iron-sulfur cluster-binding protein [Paenibacillus sp. FJAT-26967]|uniref:2Fe-2S iron-sulfur cluster-binding protein n=1 Tax=Paenibacillus sp. FJAT-26967 TaxID=1729690 RepID=UPI0008398B80|nr:2Fe-2S iron-sulfur cluster-binding protein [Paenibacillus sp. FJAT-26967]
MIELKGRSIVKEVEPVIGSTILELAREHKVDWGFNCTRGTCARCRCHVSEGMEHLTEPAEIELVRLEPEEIEEGFRLSCQAKVLSAGMVKVRHRPYF